ncbi:M23 family metallopeptidase [Sinomonas terrae]|uniref:M23 family metallopeptidase n=1 Tax=Sinomonas terrae TaxID=2908838 RepID=A0ABS9U2Q8_9MICC|nr:M23 family metallopeptidase [Sinomonas terrae]MCH6470977.1 M23 family metallopeptidase [Sinomonas terrae]
MVRILRRARLAVALLLVVPVLAVALLGVPVLGVPLLGYAAQHPAVPVALVEPAPARGWLWPLEPRPAVVRAFDPPARPWLSGHRGVDLSAAPGQGLFAPHDGVVAFAGWVVDRPVLTLDHGDGLRSSFEPAETDLDVGAQVSAGQQIGRIAVVPLHCEGACLHWGVRKDDEYISPLSLVMDTRPSILLPWRDP